MYSSVAVKMTADYEHQQVVIQHLGKKSSAISSRQLSQGDSACLVDGDMLLLLPDKYKHVVTFCDMNRSCTEPAAGHKRSADDDGSSVEPRSKRHSSASATSTSDNIANNEMCDEELDMDTKHVEMVCEYDASDLTNCSNITSTTAITLHCCETVGWLTGKHPACENNVIGFA